MSDSPAPSRRGAAILIVLATLVLAVTASVTVARIASTTKARRVAAQSTVIADELLPAADAPILAWLAAEASTVVLPPEAATPEIEVLHDRWVVDDTEYDLQITAWDQCGMVPHGVGRSGSPLRLAIPLDVLHVIDQVKIPRSQAPGLDLFLDKAGAVGEVSVFPEAAKSEPLVFGQAVSDEAGEEVRGGLPADELPERLALGAYVATHNPGRLNVNTAPVGLVRQALRLAGRGGIEQIVDARSEGRAATLASGPLADDRTRRMALDLGGTSTAWAFRIEIGVGVPGGGAVRRLWWAVYVRSETKWECAQRLAIPD